MVFKKSQLNELELQNESRKEMTLSEIERCRIRRQSITLLKETGSINDTFIVCRQCILDLTNLLLFLHNFEKIHRASDIIKSVQQIPDTQITEYFKDKEILFQILEKNDPTRKEVDALCVFMNDFFQRVESNVKKTIKKSLRTSFDDYKQKLQIVLTVLPLIVIGIYLFNNYIKNKETLKAHPSELQSGEFIKEWLVLGTIPAPEGYEGSFDMDYLRDHGGEEAIRPEVGVNYNIKGEAAISWFKHNFSDGRINFTPLLGSKPNTVVYAFTNISSPHRQKVKFVMGSDDGIKVWLNGKPVYQNTTPGAATIDEDQVDAELIEGVNNVLVKVCNLSFGSEFYFRINKIED